eukprot:4577360-Amphidinium_carterae.1
MESVQNRCKRSWKEKTMFARPACRKFKAAKNSLNEKGWVKGSVTCKGVAHRDFPRTVQETVGTQEGCNKSLPTTSSINSFGLPAHWATCHCWRDDGNLLLCPYWHGGMIKKTESRPLRQEPVEVVSKGRCSFCNCFKLPSDRSTSHVMSHFWGSQFPQLDWRKSVLHRI